MADIDPGTIVVVKPGVLWKGRDIGEKYGLVVDSESYVLVRIDGIQENVKLLRAEIEKQITEEEYYLDDLTDIFTNEDW